MTIIGVVTFWGEICTEKFPTQDETGAPKSTKSNGILNSFGRCPRLTSAPIQGPRKEGPGVCVLRNCPPGPCFGPETIVEILLVFHDGIRVSWLKKTIPIWSGRMSSPTKTKTQPGARGPFLIAQAENRNHQILRNQALRNLPKQIHDEEKPHRTETKKKHQEGSQPWWWRQIDLDGKKVSKNGWKSQK